MADSILTVTLQKQASETLDRVINLRSEIQNAWRAGVEFALNAIVRPVSANGFDYVATVGGRTENLEPKWPLAIGQIVTDGSITWQCAAPTLASCDPLTGSATITTLAPGNGLTVQSTNANGDVVVRTSGGTTNTDYANVMSVNTVGGQQINVRVNVQVRG